MKSRIRPFLFLCLVLLSYGHQVYANDRPTGSADPYSRTVYPKAFKQADLWKQYKRVLKAEKLEHLLEDENLSLVETYAPEQIQPPGCLSCFYNSRLSSWLSWAASRVPGYTLVSQAPSGAAGEPDGRPDERAEEDELSEEDLRRFSYELNKALVKRFLENKKSDSLQSIKDELWGTASYSAITGLLLGGSALILPPAVIGMGTGFGAFVIANQTASAVYSSVKQYTKLRNYFGDPLLPYEIQYAIFKRYLPQSLWEPIEAKFAFARTNPYSQSKYLKFFDTAFRLPREKQSFLLTPPIGSSAVGSNGEPSFNEKLKYTYDQMVTTIDDLFGEQYQNSDQVRLEIKTSLWEHINASIGRPHTKRNLFLVGPPGVGKTRLIQKIEEKLKIPVVTVNLSMVRDSSDLFGTEDNPGYLLEALASARVTNPILLTDEASETFNNPHIVPGLKILLEPQLGRFDSPFLKSSVNIRDSLWASLGNSQIDQPKGEVKPESADPEACENSSALASRLKTVVFPNLSPAFLRTTAYEMAPQMLAHYVYVQSMSELSQDDKKEFELIIEKSRTIRDLQNELPTWCMKVNETRRLQMKNSQQ